MLGEPFTSCCRLLHPPGTRSVRWESLRQLMGLYGAEESLPLRWA